MSNEDPAAKVINLEAARRRRRRSGHARTASAFGPAPPWPERGSAKIIAEHQRYLMDRGITRRYWKLANYRSEPDGLVIPYTAIDGGFIDFGRKRLIPAQRLHGKEAKFIQPSGQPPRLYFAPLAKTQLTWPAIAKDPSVELYIIEGELHAAAVAQHGVPAIGLGGVWNWSHKVGGASVLIDDFGLIEWRGRSVVVAYDADVTNNRNVQLAAVRLNKLLEEIT